MARVAVVTASQLVELDNWVAGVQILMAEHKPLAEELVALFTTTELIKLAQDLPFDESAANAVFPRVNRVTKSAFFDHLGTQRDAKKYAENRRWKATLATYCAAAAQFAKGKIAEELLEIARLKLAVAKRLKDIHTLAGEKGAGHLKAALVRDTPKGQT